LFDVHLLLKKEGITEEIKLGFITFMLSHARPMSELLRPHELDQHATFENQFRGMTTIPFTYDDFEATRKQLNVEIHKSLTDHEKKFLGSFKSGEPEWGLIPIDNLQNLPAVKWKLQNIRSLIANNPKKHLVMKKYLEVTLR
jgi:hypothetical protein